VPNHKKKEPRKIPQQSRSKATVEVMLTAAARVLIQDGYEKASVNKIADVAGVSIGSLYQYFPSKEALVAAVIQRQSEQMIQVFEGSVLQYAHLPVAESVRGCISCALKAHSVQPELRKVLVEQVPRTGIFFRVDEFEERLELMLRGYLEYHRAEIRPTNIELAVRLLLHAVQAMAYAVMLDDPDRLAHPEVVDEITTMVERYILRGV
jgi:AcrR family transcriptional regulator